MKQQGNFSVKQQTWITILDQLGLGLLIVTLLKENMIKQFRLILVLLN